MRLQARPAQTVSLCSENLLLFRNFDASFPEKEVRDK
jgi:hypothetical protein